MREKKKYIGINQTIQFVVLDTGIHDFLLNGEVSKENFMSHIREFTKGENRVEKAASYIMLIFKRQAEILQWLKLRITAADYINLPIQERQAITICFLTLTFPIMFDLLSVFAGVFRVQDTVSRETITKKMSFNYGSNRSLFNALDAMLPVFVETGKVKRLKPGIYSLGSIKPIKSLLVTELVIYTDIKNSQSKSILVDDINYRSMYLFFPLQFSKELKMTLIRLSDSMIGNGYLTI